MKISTQQGYASLVLTALVAAISILGLSMVFSKKDTQAQTSPEVKLYLQPSSVTIAPGTSFSVPVRLNTNGVNVNAVQADITYPSNLLTLESINTSGSAFALDVVNTGASGNISIVRGSFTPVSGNNLLVATMNFKAITAGTATLKFLDSSAAVNSSTDSLTSSPDTVLTIAAVATPTPSPSPTATPKPSATPVGQSTIKIYGAGTPVDNIYPNLRLQIKTSSGTWTTVKTFNNVQGNSSTRNFQELVYTHSSKVTPDKIRIRFINDKHAPKLGQDRNLIVDRINVDGIDIQTERETTYSEGSWSPSTGCKAGFKKSEWLHCNGFFEYR